MGWRVWRHDDGSAGFDHWRHFNGRVWRLWRHDDGSAGFDHWRHFSGRVWRLWRHDDGRVWRVWRHDDGSARFDHWRLWRHADSRVWRVWWHADGSANFDNGGCLVTGDTHIQERCARAAPGSAPSMPHDVPPLPGYWILAMSRAVCSTDQRRYVPSWHAELFYVQHSIVSAETVCSSLKATSQGKKK